MALKKYQSEFTAEEFENAIRAVPKIGDNGNWFIGDKDTGVFAGGVKITGTASIGQIIVVKAVDENGKPTEWEPVVLPNGNFKELIDYTVTEKVVHVSLTECLDGETLESKNISEVMARISIPGDEAATTGARLAIRYGHLHPQNGCIVINKMVSTSNVNCTLFLRASGIPMAMYKTNAVALTTILGDTTAELKSITMFHIWDDWNAYGVPAGTRIRIWGRS